MTSDVIIFILSSVMFGCSIFLVAYLANKVHKLINEFNSINDELFKYCDKNNDSMIKQLTNHDNYINNCIEKVNSDLYEIKLMKDTILGNVSQSYKAPIAPAEVRRGYKPNASQREAASKMMKERWAKKKAAEKVYKNPPEIREVNKLKAREYRDKLKKMGQQRADPNERANDNIIASVID